MKGQFLEGVRNNVLVNGGWGSWSEWAECTASCDGGTTNRNRSCDSPPPSKGGEDCRGAAVEMKVCNDHPCPSEYTENLIN